MNGHDAAAEKTFAARQFLSEFASGLHQSRDTHTNRPEHVPKPRKPKRRMRPISVANVPAAHDNGLSSASHEGLTRLSLADQSLHNEIPKLFPSSESHLQKSESPFLRKLQIAPSASENQVAQAPEKGTDSVPVPAGSFSPQISKHLKESSDDQSSPTKPEQQQHGLLSEALQNRAITHATHVRTIANDPTLFLEALQTLYQLTCISSSNSTEHDVSLLIYHTSRPTRLKYCQTVLSHLYDILRAYPVPIQRALNLSTTAADFPQPPTGAWVPFHPSHLSFRRLAEESSEVLPMSNRLKTNLEVTWDALLDMLRTYCGHKQEAAGSVDDEKVVSVINSLHPCNIDIFASRFVNLLSTHTVNVQQPTHIRLLDERFHAQSISFKKSKDIGVILHRVPQRVLEAFGDVPAHKFFARFLTGIDSARLYTALVPRFLARVLEALSRASNANSNHEFCDAVYEARLYARFLAVVMHSVNWSHSPFAISGSLSAPETFPPRKHKSGKEETSDADNLHSNVPQATHRKEQPERQQGKQREETRKKHSSGKTRHPNHVRSIATAETPGLGSHALQWRAWHLTALWQSVFNIDELITSAVSSKQITAIVAAAAVADVLLRFAAIDPVAKVSSWFREGLSAMKKLVVIDRGIDVQMPFVHILKIDLFSCDEISAQGSNWWENQGLDDNYVMKSDCSEWSAIGNMRLVQECCTSLALFRRNLAECSDTKWQKTTPRRITPRMTGSTDALSPLQTHTGRETNSTLGQKEQEKGNERDGQEEVRKEFLSRLDPRLRELMHIVVSSRPDNEEDAQKKFLRVAKTLYSEVPVTVRAVAAHMCGDEVKSRLQSPLAE